MAPSYIIVGSGVFGASTALHLIRKYPDASITLVDRNAFTAPTRVAASWDWNKVVRADYSDFEYTRLAWESRTLWKTDPLFKPYYHESGIYWISATGFAQTVLENFKRLGVNGGLFSHPVEDAKKLHGGLFDDADYSGIKEVLINNNSGWAEAKEALQNVIEAAVKLGVKYVEAEVTSLKFENGTEGAVKGIATKAGDVLEAERVVLCTGAYTAKLLADSAPSRTSLHVGDRFIAAGVTEAIAPLNDEQLETFKDMPVAINEVPPEKGGSNGGLPPLKENLRALKYWGQLIFRNTQRHDASGQDFSAPPAQPDYEQWNVPASLKDDVRFANNVIFGKKAQDLELSDFRICWEALTPSEDFIISPHGGCEGLYVATCGSFHGWKFFPVLGKYVVQMLDGELEAGLTNKWAWDREVPSTDENTFWPRLELKDF